MAITYDAFISYSRQDKTFAAVLQKALEAYKPPKDLEVPQRYLRVFRDEQDFTGPDYHPSLNKHLQESAKLIVICSPAASLSSFVTDEIRRFVKIRGAGHIIPVLLSGIPNNETKPGQEEEKAFPWALCDVLEMPLAADYRGYDHRKDKVKKGRFEDPWYKTLADLYDKPRALIEQREKRRQGRRRNVALAVGGFAFVLLASLIFLWLMERIKKEDERLTTLGVEARRLAQTPGNEIEALVQGVLAIDREVGTGPPPPRAMEGLIEAVFAARRSLPVKVDDTGVLHVELSPDGTLLLTAGMEGSVRTWDSHTGALRQNFPAIEAGQAAWFASFSPDGRTIVTGTGGGAVDLWEVDSGKKIRQLALIKGVPIWRVRFSPDGRRIVAGGMDGHLRLWSAVTGELIIDQVSHPSDLRIVEWSPDGAMIATARWNPEPVGDGRIRLWDGQSGAPLRDLVGHKMDVRDLVWVGDHGTASLLTGSVDASVRRWDLTTGKSSIHEHKTAVHAVAFSNVYGLPVSGDEGGNVILWTSAFDTVMSGHSGAVNDMAVAKGGDVLATGGADGTIRLWGLLPGYAGEIKRFEGHSDAVNTVVWSRDEQRLISAGEDGIARIWSLEAAKPKDVKEAIGWACNVLRHRENMSRVRTICDRHQAP